MNNKEALKVCKESAKHWDEIIAMLKKYIVVEAMYISRRSHLIGGPRFSINFSARACLAYKIHKILNNYQGHDYKSNRCDLLDKYCG